MKKFTTSDVDINNIIENEITACVSTQVVEKEEVKEMKAKQVFNFITQQIDDLGTGKKITLSYCKKVKSKEGYEMTTVNIASLEFINSKLFINGEVIKDGDVESCGNVISNCRKVLNFDLWVRELPNLEGITNLEKDREKIENLSMEQLEEIKKDRELSLKFRKDMLAMDEEWKLYHEKDLKMHKNRIHDPFMTEEEVTEGVKRVKKQLEETIARIAQSKLDVYEMTELLENVEKAINGNIKSKINTHEKLLTHLLDPLTLSLLEKEGFCGNETNLVRSLLYAINATDAYTECEDLTQGEYFRMLTRYMNNAL